MTLLADSIRFREPRRDLAVDFVDAGKTKSVEMISRRKSFDPAKPRIFQPACKDDMAIDPVSADDESSETHPDVKCDPCLLRQDSDRPVFLREGEKLVEDRAHGLRLAGEMRRERVTPTGMRLISIRECAPAIRTAPHRGPAIRSSDRSSGNGPGRCGNSRRWRARAAGNSAGTCRTSDKTRRGSRCR